MSETIISVTQVSDKTILIECWNNIEHIKSVEKNKNVIMKLIKNVMKLKVKSLIKSIRRLL